MNKIFLFFTSLFLMLCFLVGCSKSGGTSTGTTSPGNGNGGSGTPTDTTHVPVIHAYYTDEATNFTMNQQTGELIVTGLNPKAVQFGATGAGSYEWAVQFNGTETHTYVAADGATLIYPANLKTFGAPFDRTKALVRIVNKATLDTLAINLAVYSSTSGEGRIGLIGPKQEVSQVQNKITGSLQGPNTFKPNF